MPLIGEQIIWCHSKSFNKILIKMVIGFLEISLIHKHNHFFLSFILVMVHQFFLNYDNIMVKYDSHDKIQLIKRYNFL